MPSLRAPRHDRAPPAAAPAPFFALLAFVVALLGLIGQPNASAGGSGRALHPAAPFTDTAQDVRAFAVRPRASAHVDAATRLDLSGGSSAPAAIPALSADFIAPSRPGTDRVGPTTHQVATPAIIAAQPRAPPQHL